MHLTLKRSVLAVLLTAVPALAQVQPGFTQKQIQGDKETAALADVAAIPFSATLTCFQSQEEVLTAINQVITTATKALTPFKGEGAIGDIVVTNQSITQVANILEPKEFKVPERDKDGKEIVNKKTNEVVTKLVTAQVPVEGCDNSWSGSVNFALLTQKVADNALGKAEQAVTGALIQAKLLAPSAKTKADRRNRVLSQSQKVGYWLTDEGRRKIEDEITRPGAWKDLWEKYDFYKNTEKNGFAEAYVVSVGEGGGVAPRPFTRGARMGLEAMDAAPRAAMNFAAPGGAPPAPEVEAVEVGLGTIRVKSTINVTWNVRQRANYLSVPRG